MQCESEKKALKDLDRLLRPFLVLSRAFGVFPFTSASGGVVVPWWRNPWNFYSFFCLCFFCGCLVSTILLKAVTELPVSVVDVGYFATSAFYLHLIVSTAGFAYLLNCTTYWNDLCHLWSSLLLSRRTAAKMTAVLKRNVRIALALWAFNVLRGAFSCSLTLSLIFRYDVGMDLLMMALSLVWCIIANFALVGFFCTLCCAIICLLTGFCLDLDAELAEPSPDIDLQRFQDIFFGVADFVEVANHLFRNYLGSLLVVSLFQACCETYYVFTFDEADVHAIGILSWATECLVTIVAVCLLAGEIVDQVFLGLGDFMLIFSRIKPIAQHN